MKVGGSIRQDKHGGKHNIVDISLMNGSSAETIEAKNLKNWEVVKKCQ